MIFEDIANVMNARPVKEIMRKTGLTKNRVYSLRMGCTFHMDYELLFALQRMGYEVRVVGESGRGHACRRNGRRVDECAGFFRWGPGAARRDGDGKISAPVGPMSRSRAFRAAKRRRTATSAGFCLRATRGAAVTGTANTGPGGAGNRTRGFGAQRNGAERRQRRECERATWNKGTYLRQTPAGIRWGHIR